MPLAEYRQKRHFDKTTEPAGKSTRRSSAAKQAGRGKLSYVIQKHAATRLHYDFRLELDGVLKSWAVPKGPAFDPGEKRLAVEVEDHPLEYARFEGRIPEGEYGAGEVIVWDRGLWTPSGDPHEGLKRGKLEFELQGEKLQGGWVLVRLADRQQRDKPNWLLMKRRDSAARPLAEYDVLAEQPNSVKTGRTLEELRKNGEQQVAARRGLAKRGAQRLAGQQTKAVGRKKNPRTARRRQAKTRGRSSAKASKLSGATKGPMPTRLDVQLATLAAEAPHGSEWLHEIKFDGYRLLCFVESGKTRLITRRHQDWTHRYRQVAAAAAELPAESAILDGELVALLPSGVSSFQKLQNAGKPGADVHLVYFVFDLLYLDGYDLRRTPLEARKERLFNLLSELGSPVLCYSDHVAGAGAEFLRESCQLGLEGIISKRRDRPYLAGRTGDWIKAKCLGREEVVVGGYTLSTADRRGIGALLVGYFDSQQNHHTKSESLVYAGRVGTGFDTQTLHALRQRLEKIKQEQPPFGELPPKERGPLVRWVKPELVAEVRFTGWTEAGVLRQPSFQGLREDKPAAEVGPPASLVLGQKEQPMNRASTKQARKLESRRGRRSRTKPASRSPAAASDLRLTHPERVLFPDMGLTKLGLANYYAQIARWILPHVADRPLSLVRCPSGQAAGKCFYQKHVGPGTPEELGRVTIEESDGPEEYVFVRDVAGLIALVQMSVLEIHPWGATRDNVERPDRLTFDLDPGPDVSWPRVIEAAFLVRDTLAAYDLKSFLKTTGGKGLHVVVPLAPRREGWERARQFCKHIAEQIVQQEPHGYTANMSKAQRRGKVFLDYLRNDRGATAVAAYSTRARPGAPVSVPLEWNELTPVVRSDHYHVDNLPARLEALKRDPWKGIADIQQRLPRVRE